MTVSEAPEPPTPLGTRIESRDPSDLGDGAPQRGQYACAEGRYLELTFLTLPRGRRDILLRQCGSWAVAFGFNIEGPPSGHTDSTQFLGPSRTISALCLSTAVTTDSLRQG